jgi:hypothetical protein
MSYFIVRSGEGGTVIDGPMTAAEVLKKTTPDKNGNAYYGSGLTFLKDIPPNDGGYWSGVEDGALLVIKGEIVVPRPVEITTRLELP